MLAYAYDNASRLTGLTYTLGAVTLGTLTYTPDAAGNRTAIGGTWARTGLPAAVATASYNANHQQLTFGGATVTYDLNGNLATLADAGGTTTFTWNLRNQLTSLSGPGLSASFGYDALGRRWTKTVNAAQTDFLYDGLNPVQEGVLPSTPVANLLTGLGLDEVLTRTDAAGLRAFLADALGSPLALADGTGTSRRSTRTRPSARRPPPARPRRTRISSPGGKPTARACIIIGRGTTTRRCSGSSAKTHSSSPAVT